MSASVRSRILILGVTLFAGLPALPDLRGDDSAEIEFFERRIRPLFVERCLTCHGPETQENNLRLDSRESAVRGGDSGPAIVPGQPGMSHIVQALRGQADIEMPPTGPLPAEDIAAIERWIEIGAPWPAPLQPSTPHGDGQRKARLATLREKHWAFQPILRPPIPRVDNDWWSRNAIDRFVLARLNHRGFSPTLPADRGTLIRRLYFDLLGLPPTASELRAFGSDNSPRAYERLVERLLARPEYGERWARHWLDVARYADTTGYQEGGQRRYPFAWTYRDYVVRSWNEDTPFDEFVVEQLAADQLELTSHERWKLAAMGFLTLGPRFNYVRHEIIDDRIDVVTRGLMGLTVTCARCHDHKYDPILADDYYGLYGVFANSTEPLYADLPRIGHSRGRFDRYREFRRQAARAAGRFEQFHARVHRRIQREMRAIAGEYLRHLVQLMPEHRTVNQPTFETERGYLRGPTPYGPGALVRWQHYVDSCGNQDPVFGLWNQIAALSRDEIERAIKDRVERGTWINPRLRAALTEAAPRDMLEIATIYGEVLERTEAEWLAYREAHPAAARLPDPAAEELRQVLYAYDSPVSMNEDEAHDCYTDGEFNEYMGLKRELDSLFVEYQDVAAPRAMIMRDRTEPSEPRLFARGNPTRPGRLTARRFLRVFEAVDGGDSFSPGSGRMQLAKAIVNPRNPLTARVIVNRVWQWHFGRGLVDTASDFGTRADPPSHPKLLDWLASGLIEHEWSLKWLHRQIVVSATYRQASWHHDSQTYRPRELFSPMSRRRLGFEALRDSLLHAAGNLDQQMGGQPSERFESARRTLYLLVNRDDPPGMFRTFDFPSPDISAAKRSETTVPQQALFLMNSEFTARVVKQLVARMNQEMVNKRVDTALADVDQRIQWLYLRVLSRPATDREITLARAAVRQSAAATGDHNPWIDLAHVLIMSNEFMFVD